MEPDKKVVVEKPTAQLPSLGCIVLWYELGSVENPGQASIAYPAIISKVFEPNNPFSRVGLTVCKSYPTLTSEQQDVIMPAPIQYLEANYGEDDTGCWAWPPNVAPARA